MSKQDTFDGRRGVECPKCHKMVTVYSKAEAEGQAEAGEKNKEGEQQ